MPSMPGYSAPESPRGIHQTTEGARFRPPHRRMMRDAPATAVVEVRNVAPVTECGPTKLMRRMMRDLEPTIYIAGDSTRGEPHEVWPQATRSSTLYHQFRYGECSSSHLDSPATDQAILLFITARFCLQHGSLLVHDHPTLSTRTPFYDDAPSRAITAMRH